MVRRADWLTAAAILAAAGSAFAAQDDPRLDALFARLQATDSVAEATRIQDQIWAIWMQSDEPADNETMMFGVTAMGLRQLEVALQAFDRLVAQAPDFAEAWNKRATVRFMMGDMLASAADVERTLALEPRHFGALSGLGMIFEAIGEPRGAIEAYERAIAVNPHLTGLREHIEALRGSLAGESL